MIIVVFNSYLSKKSHASLGCTAFSLFLISSHTFAIAAAGSVSTFCSVGPQVVVWPL